MIPGVISCMPLCRILGKTSGMTATALLRAALVLAGLASAAAAAPLSQDAYPLGTVAFFNAQSCPTGWQTASKQSGFTLMPFTSIPSGAQGSTTNAALGSGQTFGHSHASLLSSITLRTNRYGGFSGSGDHSTSKSGTLPVNGGTDFDDANIPYLQLLVCAKVAFQPLPNPPVGLPPGIAAQFLLDACPGGWKPFAASNGRFLVGLPAGGTPGTPFGGPAYTSIGANNTHAHPFSGSFNIPSTSVALAPCCNGSYGSAGAYPFQGITSAALIPVPYAATSQCMPCVADDPACNSQ